MKEQWEYLVVPLQGVPEDAEAALNQYGLEGWELVSVSSVHPDFMPRSMSYTFAVFLKRALSDS